LGATAVNFGGLPAVSFTVVSSTVITATVGSAPTGSISISVTTPGGTAVRQGFYIGPAIKSFTPSSGPVGTTVIISGTRFSTNTVSNYVYFGAAKANVLSATDTTLTVTVPAGASYEPITVTTENLTAYSDRPFIVTFRKSGTAFTPSTFVDRMDSTAGNFPLHTSITDLNNDGKPDVVVTNTVPSTISVYKNTSTSGAVSVAGKVDYATGTIPVASAIADLDGDGKPDIVVLTKENTVTSTLSYSVFRNITAADTILLAPKVDYPLSLTSGEPVSAIIRDFDIDGKPDLALFSLSSISVFRNTSTPGTVAFSAQPECFLPGSLITSIFTCDVDGDGKPDIVSTERSDRAQVFRNISGEGRILFAPGISIETGFSPESVSFGDLNNDGKPDMAVTNPGNNSVSVYRNTSTRDVISFDPRINYQLGNIPYNVTISDLDGDGKPDLAVATRNASSISVLKNTGTNGNISFADHVEYYDGYNQRYVFAANMNGDGKPDLVTPNPNGNNFSIFVNEWPDDVSPAAYINVSGPTDFCEGGSVLLKTSAASGSSFQWYNDGLLLPTATDSVFLATTSGAYSVTVMNGSTVATSAVVVVTVKSPAPAPTISLSGLLPLCPGANAILKSSTASGNQWYRNDTLIPGATDTVYRVRTSGVFRVKTNSNGCSSLFSDGVTVITNSMPAAAIITSATAFCTGDSLLLNSNASGGMTSQWNINENQIPGGIGNSYVTRIPGNFTVTISSNGCSTVSPAVTVTTKPVPGKPVVTQVDSILVSSSANGNQWYHEGVAIPGATSQSYTPADSGNYLVTVAVNGCVSPMSDNYNYVIVPVVIIDNNHSMKLSPNPVKDRLTVSFDQATANSVNITIVDIQGRIFARWDNITNGDKIDLSRLPRGIYILNIQSDKIKKAYTLKLMKG
jgi:hypothetical protein